jgi:hypothetical protein
MVVDTQSKHCAASAGALLVRVWPIKCASSPGALTGGLAAGRVDGAAATSDEQSWLCPVRRLVAAQVPAEPVVAARQYGLVPPLRAVERHEQLGTSLQDLKASVDQLLSSVIFATDSNEPSRTQSWPATCWTRRHCAVCKQRSWRRCCSVGSLVCFIDRYT